MTDRDRHIYCFRPRSMKKLDENIKWLLLLLNRAIYMLNYFHFFHHYSCFIKVSFNLYGKSEGEKLWPTSWKYCPRPQAKGSIFKPEVDFFIFFPLRLIGLSLFTPLCLALDRLTCLLQTIRKNYSQQLITYLIPDIKVCVKEQIRLILTKLTKSECLQR